MLCWLIDILKTRQKEGEALFQAAMRVIRKTAVRVFWRYFVFEIFVRAHQELVKSVPAGDSE